MENNEIKRLLAEAKSYLSGDVSDEDCIAAVSLIEEVARINDRRAAPAAGTGTIDTDKLVDLLEAYRNADVSKDVTAKFRAVNAVEEFVAARAEEARREGEKAGYDGRNAEVDALILEKWALEEKLAAAQRPAGGDAVMFRSFDTPPPENTQVIWRDAAGRIGTGYYSAGDADDLRGCEWVAADVLAKLGRAPVEEAAAQADGNLSQRILDIEAKPDEGWSDAEENTYLLGHRDAREAAAELAAAPTAQPTPVPSSIDFTRSTAFRFEGNKHLVEAPNPVFRVGGAQPTPPDDERAAWSFKQWWEHVGAWETSEGFISFGSPMAVRAMLIQYGRMVEAANREKTG